MEIFVGNQHTSSPMSQSIGAILFITNQTNFRIEENKGMLLRPGSEIHIAVERTFSHNLKKKDSDCVSVNFESWPQQLDNNKTLENLFKTTINKNGCYSQSYCLLLCEKLNKCDSLDDCVIDIEPQFVSDLNHNINDNCSKLCPKQCENVEYESEYSLTNYPSRFHSKIILNSQLAKSNKLKKIEEEAEFLSNIFYLKVYYKKKTYIVITEVRKISFNDLLANLGGQLGLFLGIYKLIELNS
jgi:hypothetical protein